MHDNYWLNRVATSQNAISDKNVKKTEKQLRIYYQNTMKKVIADFEAVYDKLLNAIEDGREPTPADLYKLDKYWEMQGQLRKELRKLGEKEVALLSKRFEENYFDIYYSLAIPGMKAFNTVSNEAAKQMINQIWVADGKSWSQRIWEDTERLADTLNDNLIHCVVTGKKTTELKNILQERFNVSYNRADMLVRTEITNIQTQAAKQRYEDYGLKYYQFYADPDERTCSECKDMHNKKFLYAEMKPGVNAPPMHPNDRCCIVPVIED